MTIIENTSDARDILDTETKNHYGTPTDVSNDVPTDTIDALAAQNSTLRENAASLLQSLEADRLQWETGAYRTSNQSLYALLARCLEYSGELPAKSQVCDEYNSWNFHPDHKQHLSARQGYERSLCVG
jgi:hypothetical protein